MIDCPAFSRALFSFLRGVLAPELGEFYADMGGAGHVLQGNIFERAMYILHTGEEIGRGQAALCEL